jgi:hypothetical protein
MFQLEASVIAGFATVNLASSPHGAQTLLL